MARAVPLLLALASALTACSQQHADAPPPEFGAIERAWFGCPSMEGVYAWPPIAGEYAGGKIASNRRAWEDGKPVPVHGKEMQIWVKEKGGSALWFRARSVNRALPPNTPLAGGWSFNEYHRGQWRCKGSMIEMAPEEIGAQANFGGTGARRSFKLARMQDGALAVGIATVAHGGTDYLYSYDGVHAGPVKTPDRHFWAWSKLARTGSGDTEPGSAPAP
ncbi:hypothetical protein [Massilia sp. CF038]|uniref:hypothetical protein n=1 Tax=Massilia sp. CF038 TaxID=1881045 RepID=UPI00091D7223|nr:hypothetical protein [Massilia sp. CF038]SHG53524.1 hypothetical protein SAMN05428948_0914 [Massilia sp. CF038]